MRLAFESGRRLELDGVEAKDADNHKNADNGREVLVSVACIL